MDWFSLILLLLINLFITAFLYLLFPIIIILTKKKLTRKRIWKITIINAICVFLFISILYILQGNYKIANISPAVIWSSIGYAILNKASGLGRIRFCRKCGKKIHRRTYCRRCGTDIVEETTSNLMCQKCHQLLPDDSTFCHFCGEKISISFNLSKEQFDDVPHTTSVSITEQTSPNSNPMTYVVKHQPSLQNRNSLFIFAVTSTIVLSFISICSILLALNLQDVCRNDFENWNPTMVYLGLVMAFCIFLFCVIFSIFTKKSSPLLYGAVLVICLSIIAFSEGSVFSVGYYNPYSYSKYGSLGGYDTYHNWEAVAALNCVWVISIILIACISLLLATYNAINIVKRKWYASIRYREKCYSRLTRINGYLEKGIISKEEYEKAKAEILKNIP